MEIIFLTQTGAGILGNSSLLCLYCFTLLAGQKMRPTDSILNQLVLANSVVLFCRGIPQTMAVFGWKPFLGDAGCKIVLYFHRVTRGVSLNTTCLLSGFQTTKLCSGTSGWKESRNRFPTLFGLCGFFFWILQLLVNVYIPMGVTGPRTDQNMSTNMNYRYCSAPMSKTFISLLHTVIFSSIDGICLGFMIWASGSMVLVLHRHTQRVQYIHSHCLSPRFAHEARATRTILILVSMFVSFYCLSSIFTVCITLKNNPSQWLVDTSVFLAACFPALSPFVLINSDSRVSHLFDFCTRKKMFIPWLNSCFSSDFCR